ITLARAQKSPRRDLSSTKLPGSQTRCVVTRAPWELMLCVEVASALQLRLRLASSTGSAKIVRASLRMPPLVPAFTSLGWDTWYLPHPHYRLESCSVNPVFTLNCRPKNLSAPFRHFPRLPVSEPCFPPNSSNSQRFNALPPRSNDTQKVIDTYCTFVLFFRVFANQHPRLQTVRRFNVYASIPSPVFSCSYKLLPSSHCKTSSSFSCVYKLPSSQPLSFDILTNARGCRWIPVFASNFQHLASAFSHSSAPFCS